jgi:hypothetical protein
MPEAGAGLRCHQVAVAGVVARAEQVREEAGATGGEDRRTGDDTIGRVALLPMDAACTADGAVRPPQQFEHGTLVEDGDAEVGNLLAQRAHVFGATQAAILDDSILVLRKLVVARERRQRFPRERDHAFHPCGIAEAEAARRARLDGCGACGRRIGRHPPVAGSCGGGDTAGAAITLLDQNDRRTGACGGGCRPCAGHAAADHQHVGVVADVLRYTHEVSAPVGASWLVTPSQVSNC